MPFSIPELHAGTVQYNFEQGLLMPTLDWTRIRADSEVGRQICQWYEPAPEYDEQAVPAYEALRAEVVRQFNFLTRPVAKGGLGVDVRRQVTRPYSRVGSLVTELREQRRFRVLKSSYSCGSHPFFTNDEYDALRAVHQILGHAVIRAEFDADGSEAAWIRHSTMLSPQARRALATETRAQACVALYTERLGNDYPPLKMVLMPEEFAEPAYEVWR